MATKYLCPTDDGPCPTPKSCVELGVAVCDYVRESTAACGVPTTITDRETLATIARLLGVR